MSLRRIVVALFAAALAAAVLLPLTAWLAETVSIDCRRSGSPPRCLLELSYRNHTELHAVDVAALVGASVVSRMRRDADGSMDETWHLRIEVRADGPSGKPGIIETAAGDREAHRARAGQINAFVATPAQSTLNMHFDDRSYRLGLAWILIATIAFGAYTLARAR